MDACLLLNRHNPTCQTFTIGSHSPVLTCKRSPCSLWYPSPPSNLLAPSYHQLTALTLTSTLQGLCFFSGTSVNSPLFFLFFFFFLRWGSVYVALVESLTQTQEPKWSCHPRLLSDGDHKPMPGLNSHFLLEPLHTLLFFLYLCYAEYIKLGTWPLEHFPISFLYLYSDFIRGCVCTGEWDTGLLSKNQKNTIRTHLRCLGSLVIGKTYEQCLLATFSQRSKPTKWRDSVAIIQTSSKNYLHIATGHKYLSAASKMVQQVKMLSTKPGNLSLIPGRHMLERTDSHKFSSEPQTYTMAPVHTDSICVHTQIHVK